MPSEICNTDAPGLFSPELNFGAGGSVRQIVSLHTKKRGSGSLSAINASRKQTAQFVKACAAQQLCERVVVFGMSDAVKLASLVGAPNIEVIAVTSFEGSDEKSNTSGTVKRMIADLGDPDDMDRVKEQLAKVDISSLFLVSCVLEHIRDVRPLLRCIRFLLRLCPKNRLVILTPDRVWAETNDFDCTEFFRLWTGTELRCALGQGGFRVEKLSALKQKGHELLCAMVSCDEKFYEGYLSGIGLPPIAEHLVLTSEHAMAEATGGIGTYHQLVQEVTGLPRIIMFTGMHGLDQKRQEYVEKKGWAHVAQLVPDKSEINADPWSHNREAILLAVLQAIFLYDMIRLIEFQDYYGIGMRIAQAKRARMLPSSVTVLTYAHGTHFYLDHAAAAVSDVRDIRIDVQERLGLELSDVVAFPSEFLYNLYVKEQGLSLRSVEMQAYPINVSLIKLASVKPVKASTLVFYGKQTAQKGYPDFCDAVIELFSNPEYQRAAHAISRIALMGVQDPDARLLALKGVTIISGTWTRQRAFDILREFGEESIVVLPYRADNHPLSIFEVVEAGCQLLAYRAGGLPEILPEILHDRLLCAPGYLPLAAALAREIVESPNERASLIKRLGKLLAEKYSDTSSRYVDFIGRLKRMSTPTRLQQGAVSVIVPNYNGPANYIDDVGFGLLNSTKSPAQVIFVDDRSSDTGYETLKNAAGALSALNIHLVRNASNVGLAQSRNNGLDLVETPYVCAHDNDNVISNSFLQEACRVLDENPDVAVVTCWLTGFKDGEDWTLYDAKGYRYRPVGQDLGLGTLTNEFGDALAVYRTSTLREVGGWDGTSRALWEDWQLFLRITALGEKIILIPKEMFFYRIRPDSMARTYNHFYGHMRLVGALPGLPRSQAYGLFRATISSRIEVQQELEHLRWELRNKQEEVNIQSRRCASILAASRSEMSLMRRRHQAELSKSKLETEISGTKKISPLDHLSSVPRKASQGAEFDVSEVQYKDLPRSEAGVFARLTDVIKRANKEEQLLKRCAFFDADWYYKKYPEIGRRNPFRDYLNRGAAIGRDPGPFFNSLQYLSDHADVARSGMNPLVHYVRHGLSENRRVENSKLA